MFLDVNTDTLTLNKVCACAIIVCVCLGVAGRGAAETVALSGVVCCGLDPALLWHPPGILFPALHPTL